MRVVSAVLFALGLSACQVVLGDFTIGPVPEEGELGGACRPDEYRCTGAVLEVCANDRRGFVAVRSCDSPNHCSVKTGSCRPCTPGEVECHGQTLVTCGNDLSWSGSDCAAGTRCENREDGSASCVPRACGEGSLSCEGSRLLQCESDGVLEESELCATPELCAASLQQTLGPNTPRARCAAAACEPGQFSCDGAVLRRCSFGRNGWDVLTTCPSAELCNPSAGDCSACTPGEVACAGPDVIRCTDAGAFERVRTCTSNLACVEDGEGCKRPDCDTPGLFRCGDANGLEVCSPGGGWELSVVCATAGLCSASQGRCMEPACRGGERRCVGNERQECSADLSRFQRVEVCRAGTTCDAMLGCVPGACTDGEVRCNGIFLERCVAGVFQRERRCATPELCDAGNAVCLPPLCGGARDHFNCASSTIQECNPGRTGWLDRDEPCLAQEICHVGYAALGPAHCAQCTADQFRCDGTSLLRCASDGRSEPVVAECPNGCDPAGSCL